MPAYSTRGSLDAAIKLWDKVSRSIVGEEDSDDHVEVNEIAKSLEYAYLHYTSSTDARQFADKYLTRIVKMLLENPRGMLNDYAEKEEKECRIIEDSLRFALKIVCDDLKRMENNDINSLEESSNINGCATFTTLKCILDKSNGLYNVLPNIRREMIRSFQSMGGYASVAICLSGRTAMHQFPLDLPIILFQIVQEKKRLEGVLKIIQEDILKIANLTLTHIEWLDNSSLEKVEALERDKDSRIGRTGNQLYKVYRRCGPDSKAIVNFASSWKSLALKWIMSQRHPVNLLGWEQIQLLVKIHETHIPPKAYIVSGAGSDFVNGRYEFDPTRVSERGSVKRPNVELQYHRQIPDDHADEEKAGKTLTLFRCTMRSQHKWWFLSIPDEGQPGTDRDIDYYQFKSKPGNDKLPSLSGWRTCRAGVDPAPILKPVGMVCPDKTRYNTLDYRLARWAIENQLVEICLGDSTNHEIVDLSSDLILFLARICHKYDWLSEDESDMATVTPARFCLNESHIILARNFSSKTTDAMALGKLYRMLLTLHSEAKLSNHLKVLVPPVIKSTMMRQIQLSDPTLLQLQIGSSFTPASNNAEVGVYNPSDTADFSELGRNIGLNTHVTRLQFDGTLDALFDDADALSAGLTGLTSNASVRALSFQNCNISCGVGNGILSAFEERLVLIELSLSNCDLSNGGTSLLGSTLRSCPCLEKVDLAGNNLDNDMLVDIVAAIRGLSELEYLDLARNRIEEAGCLADLLQDPQCNLHTLNLKGNQLGNGLIAFASAVSQNSTLEKLLLGATTEVVDDAFSQVLCDTSSVDATYLSNHTLNHIESSGFISNFLQSNLEKNLTVNKKQVAIKKILRHHPHFDMEPFFEWDIGVLPNAIRWFDSAIDCTENVDSISYVERRKLSAIYQFAKAMPLFIVPPPPKPLRRSKRKRPQL